MSNRTHVLASNCVDSALIGSCLEELLNRLGTLAGRRELRRLGLSNRQLGGLRRLAVVTTVARRWTHGWRSVGTHGGTTGGSEQAGWDERTGYIRDGCAKRVTRTRTGTGGGSCGFRGFLSLVVN
jgi:hypothetical protein